MKVISLGSDGTARISLEQDSGAQGALLAIDNGTGQIKAMVGGRDFNESKFNRTTQALRQVGSSFKPYVYTAVIDQGGGPDDTVLDAPITFEVGTTSYTPHNYDDKFEGTITLRRALAQSRNIPTLRLADRIGIKTVIDYAHRFGITSNLPPYLPVALGAAEITLLEQTSAYSVFPNDGVRVTPRLGVVLDQHFLKFAGALALVLHFGAEADDVRDRDLERLLVGVFSAPIDHVESRDRPPHRALLVGIVVPTVL